MELVLRSVKLNNLIDLQFPDTRNEMQKLDQTRKSIRSLLEDAEEKQLGDEEVSEFLGRLRDLVYCADDVLDEWFIYLKQRNYTSKLSSPSSTKISSLGKAFNRCVSFDKFKKIRSLRTKLEKMITESLEFDLKNNNSVPPEESWAHSYDSSSFFYGDDKVVVYGRELDKEIIMKKLLEDDDTFGVKVVSIVGMGGLGKTTLAQSVYNDDEVKSYFDTRVWVTVPQTASSYLERTVQKILKGLSLQSGGDSGSGGNSHGGADIDRSMSLLKTSIKQKKFLLVLDDIWDEDVKKWQSLKNSLNDGVPGSSILILTRNKMAAYLMSTTTIHELKPLSQESAWELFSRTAFAKQDNGEDALKPFEDIGRIVTQRCNGVPLALKCLGGLLRTKSTTQEWEDVMESDKWELLEMEPILPALYFGYYSLPPVLKLCFAYCSIFPKAYEITKRTLIRMWMAEGFLSSSSTTKDSDPESIGEECFRELMIRSYFNPCKRNKDGEVTYIKMHDLVYDLAASITGRSVVKIDHNATLKTNKARHLTVLHSDLDSVASSVRKANHISTLNLFECSLISSTVSPHLFAHLKVLRVLDLSCLDLAEIPDEVGKLKHLRYLNLSHTKLQYLPDKVCNLLNLQTLCLKYCKQLSKLPDNLANLSGLRHLEIQSTPELLYLPLGIGRLTSLRTLSKFPVSIMKVGAKIGELKDLNKLQGYIYITGLHSGKYLKEANDARLMNKENLHEVHLDFAPYKLENLGEDEFRKTETVLENLHSHPNIKKMVLTHFLGLKLPRWLENNSLLPNIRSLKIQDCMNCTKLPALGNLPSLKELYMGNLDSIKDIGNEFYGIGSSFEYVKEIAFPKLEELHLVDMAQLERCDFIARDEKIMPCIRDLYIQNCPKLVVLPHFFLDSLKIVKISHCPKLNSCALTRETLEIL